MRKSNCIYCNFPIYFINKNEELTDKEKEFIGYYKTQYIPDSELQEIILYLEHHKKTCCTQSRADFEWAGTQAWEDAKKEDEEDRKFYERNKEKYKDKNSKCPFCRGTLLGSTVLQIPEIDEIYSKYDNMPDKNPVKQFLNSILNEKPYTPSENITDRFLVKDKKTIKMKPILIPFCDIHKKQMTALKHTWHENYEKSWYCPECWKE